MPRREHLSNWPCGEPSCKERGLYRYDTKRELQEAAARYAKEPWRCSRHTQADEVLTFAQPRREVTMVASKVGSLPGLFWREDGGKGRAGSGFRFGPGFKAWATDFPEGTQLIVTAEVVLPDA